MLVTIVAMTDQYGISGEQGGTHLGGARHSWVVLGIARVRSSGEISQVRVGQA